MEAERDVERTQRIAATLFTLSSTILALLILWFSSFEDPPLHYMNLPFPIRGQEFKPGGIVPMVIERCNSTSTTFTYVVTRYLQSMDGEASIVLESKTMKLLPGCAVDERDNVLPKNLKPGKYRFVGTGGVNGMVKQLEVEWYSQTFSVSDK